MIMIIFVVIIIIVVIVIVLHCTINNGIFFSGHKWNDPYRKYLEINNKLSEMNIIECIKTTESIWQN